MSGLQAVAGSSGRFIHEWAAGGSSTQLGWQHTGGSSMQAFPPPTCWYSRSRADAEGCPLCARMAPLSSSAKAARQGACREGKGGRGGG